MARGEDPGMIPGTSQKDDLLNLPTPTRIDPEIGEGALLLGMIAAGNATVLSVIQNGFAPVVATPMTGDGDKPCDGVSKGGGSFWGKNLGRFSSIFACKSKKNPSDLLGISHSNSKNRYSATSK